MQRLTKLKITACDRYNKILKRSQIGWKEVQNDWLGNRSYRLVKLVNSVYLSHKINQVSWRI